MQKRILLALLVSVVIFGAFYASAANLGVDGGVVQAGLDGTLTCDPNGVTVDGWGYEADEMNVYYVRIGDIDAACVGEELTVGVYDSNGDIITNTSPAAITGASQTFHFDDPVDAINIYRISVAITS